MVARKSPRRTASDAPEIKPSWFEVWDRMSPGRRHGVCAAALLLVGVTFMAPVLFGDGRLVGGDIVHWSGMSRGLVEAKEATGHRPLWAVRPFAGMPAYMISYDLVVPQIDLVADPLRRLMWPLSHLLILFAGTYLLTFVLTRDRLAGVMAAVAFGLTTYLPVLLIAGHNSKFIALSFLPWLLLAFVHALRRPGLVSGLLFAVAVGLNLRAGHVQITYYGAFVIGIWWLVEAVSSLRQGRLRELGSSTLWLAVGGVLGVMMVADPYLVQAEYRGFTIRGASSGGGEGGMAWDYAMAWSQGVGELLTLVIADAFGGGGATYWGPKTFTAGPHYLGGIVIMLAAIALAWSRQRTVAALAVAGVLMIGFALGENLEVLNRLMFEHFPLFASFRVPETWMSAVALVLAVLAGLGLAESMRRDRDAKDDASRSRLVYRVAGVAVVVTAVLALWGDSFLSFERAGEYERFVARLEQARPDLSADDPQVQRAITQEIARYRAARVDAFASDARRTALFVLVAGLLLVLARRRRLPGWVAAFGLVALAAFDLGGVGRRYVNGEALVDAQAPADLVATSAFDRYIMDRRDEAGGDGSFRVLSLEGDPTVTSRPAAHYESLGGYHGAKLRRYQDFLESMLFDERGRLSMTALRMANVRYVAASRPPVAMESEYVDDQTGFSVFRVPGALPRAWFVDTVTVIPDPDAQWARMAEPDFDPATEALVAGDVGLAPAPRDSASVVSVRMESYAAESIRWTVETDRPRLLVVSEVYYPAGWTARIDGEAAEIRPANHAFRGVVVPGGRHEVTMTFEPRTRRLGVVVAGASTAAVYGGLLLLLGLAWLKRRKGMQA
jgi:hypothetical protein